MYTLFFMQWNMQIWNIISTSVYLAQQLLHMISIAWMRLFCKWKIDFVLAIMAMLSTDKEEKNDVFYLWTFELLISRHHHMTRKIHWLFCDWLKRTWHRPLANIKGSLTLCWVYHCYGMSIILIQMPNKTQKLKCLYSGNSRIYGVTIGI